MCKSIFAVHASLRKHRYTSDSPVCGYIAMDSTSFSGAKCLDTLSERHNYTYTPKGGPMAKSRASRKKEALRQHGSLNPRPEGVRHELFRTNEFFDPDDLVQVKYEMLRQVLVERASVTKAAADLGLSRPSFYEAQEVFEESCLLGLFPERRGRLRAH